MFRATMATMIVGAILGVVGVVASVILGVANWLTVAPIIIGLLFVALGALAQHERYHRPALYGTIGLSVAGAALGLIGLAQMVSGGLQFSAQFVTHLITALLCGGLLVTGIRAYLGVRRPQAA